MRINLKSVIRSSCPPGLWRLASRLKHQRAESKAPIRFSGDYKSWEEAERAATGYSAAEILEKTRRAMQKVRDGEAVYERDSIIFDEIQHSFPLLAGLLRVATANENLLSVLDFGGALGSSYFQCRQFLSVAKQLRWNVVEQPAHVACGQAEFSNDHLHFYRTIDECLVAEQPNVLLLSGVVQYLPEPYKFLAESLRHEFTYVIVDRTAFLRNGGDLLTVQHVPAWIYHASYPAWFLSEGQFLACFNHGYDLLASFPAPGSLQFDGGLADYKGFIFKLKK